MKHLTVLAVTVLLVEACSSPSGVPNPPDDSSLSETLADSAAPSTSSDAGGDPSTMDGALVNTSDAGDPFDAGSYVIALDADVADSGPGADADADATVPTDSGVRLPPAWIDSEGTTPVTVDIHCTSMREIFARTNCASVVAPHMCVEAEASESCKGTVTTHYVPGFRHYLNLSVDETTCTRSSEILTKCDVSPPVGVGCMPSGPPLNTCPSIGSVVVSSSSSWPLWPLDETTLTGDYSSMNADPTTRVGNDFTQVTSRYFSPSEKYFSARVGNCKQADGPASYRRSLGFQVAEGALVASSQPTAWGYDFGREGLCTITVR